MIENTDDYLRINEVKNYLYCPRISYYTLCLGIDIETDLSKAGIAEESQTKTRMKRRKYALHSVHEGSRQFDVPLFSRQFRFVGKLDEMVVTDAGVYLVDYKDTTKDYGYWKLQLHAYRIALEEMGFSVLGAYVYSIPEKTYKLIETGLKETGQLAELCQKLRIMVERERCPEPTNSIAKCHSCQYQRFCNDVS